MSNDPIARLLKPRSVAVIGASADPTKTAGRPVAYLQRHGFAGAIYPVNPRAAEIGGLKSYPDVPSLPEAPDVGIVLLGAERAHEAVGGGRAPQGRVRGHHRAGEPLHHRAPRSTA